MDYRGHVRFGSKADIALRPRHVRLAKSEHRTKHKGPEILTEALFGSEFNRSDGRPAHPLRFLRQPISSIVPLIFHLEPLGGLIKSRPKQCGNPSIP